jgi:transcriptional regulator with XRE-family HTH domain
VNTDTASLRLRIRERLVALGISAREASRRAGFNVGYVGDLLEGRSKAPNVERIIKLADALEMPAGELLDDSQVELASRAPAQKAADLMPLYTPRIDLNSTTALMPAEPSAFVPMLPALAGVVGAYAVRVWNDRCAPRYCVGETIYVSPDGAPSDGEWALMRLDNGTAYIHRFSTEGFGDSADIADDGGKVGVESAHRIVGATT